MTRATAISALGMLLLGCSGKSTPAGPVAFRVGYFANVTHAPAIVAIESGFLEDALGDKAAIEPHTFNAGPEAVEAIFSGVLDLAYIGPNPAINAFHRSGGEAIRIIAGATSGGASLVVAPAITSAGQLKGKTLASPQRGNTQDVALRSWLKTQQLSSDLEGGGDVSIMPQANAQTLETFRAGRIQGAWVPEPWATRLVLEGGGRELVDERSLWPGGKFVTTHVIVRTAFLKEHPDLVEAFLRAHVRAIDSLNADPAAGRALVNQVIGRITGKPLGAETIERAWSRLTFTLDPVASSLRKAADDAVAAGLLEPGSLQGIYDLTLLNKMLAASGRPQVVD